MSDAYARLIDDTLTFLKEEGFLEKRLFVSKESYAFFSLAKAEKKKTPLLPPVVQAPAFIPREEPKKKEPAKTEEVTMAKPPPPLKKEPHEEIRTLIARVHPHLPLASEIPSDEQGARIANAWREQEHVLPVALLSFSDHSKELSFLSQVATAITSHFLKASVIDGARLEREKKWDLFLKTPHLRLIIAYQFPKVFYLENLATSEKFLGKTPLLVISPPSFYLQNPEAKRTLWKTLCNLLQSS
jgi:hypothetical protein